MVKEYSSFSPCGKTFAYCGTDGKLRLWDTLSGILKQEFVPNLHLNQPCTSFVWLTFAKVSATPRKKKKRKSDITNSNELGLGTNNGVVAIYNISEGKITCSLQGGHSTAVSSLSWCKTNELFSAAENSVAVWNLESKSVKSKWKCGKSRINCMDVSEDGEICVTGSFTIKVWNVQSKELIKELSGHSSEITNIQFINNSQSFLSTACNDRYVTVWNVQEDQDDPVGRFVLEDAVKGSISLSETDNSIRLGATCSRGVFYYFSHQFNGSRSKAIKNVYRVEIASGSQIENGKSSPDKADSGVVSEISRLPIIAVYLVSSTSAKIVYGESPAFTFETIDIKETKESLYLVRAPVDRKSSKINKKDGVEPMLEDAEYIGGGIIGGGGKRLRDSKGKEVPLEDRLINLSTQDLTASCTDQDPNSPHSMAQLLSQALQSKDRSMLETVLFRKELSIVKQTVAKLPVNLIPSLIKELFTMIHAKALTSSIAIVWLKSLLAHNSSQLLADEQSLSNLANLQGLVETRISTLPKLFKLSGRLDLLLQQLHGHNKSNETDQPALLVYQDEDSSDEGSSLGGENNENHSESDDKWDELSDLGTEEMST